MRPLAILSGLPVTTTRNREGNLPVDTARLFADIGSREEGGGTTLIFSSSGLSRLDRN